MGLLLALGYYFAELIEARAMLCPDELRRLAEHNRRMAQIEKDPALAEELIQLAEISEAEAIAMEKVDRDCDPTKTLFLPNT